MSEEDYKEELESHEKGNPQCKECCCAYPEECECGGLMHVVDLEEVAYGDDYAWHHTLMCDKCGKLEG